MTETNDQSVRRWPAFDSSHEDRDRRLIDQYITVRVLTHVISTLVLVAAGAWWFLFDEVKSVGRDITLQRTELLQEVGRNGMFQAQQRSQLGDRVDDLQDKIQGLQADVGELRAGVLHIGRTTDAIFSIVVSERTEREERQP